MSKYIINNDEYIVRKINEQYVFLKFANGDSHLLDDIGTIFLDFYLNYNNPIDKLIEYFSDVDFEIIKKDFSDFLNQLIENGMLIKGENN